MRRAGVLMVALAASIGLAACGHAHLPYLPGDRAFQASDDDGAVDRRIDPVQTRHPVASGRRPPCKFGGKRCPPWERAWPAAPGVSAADTVTDAGKVVPPGASAR